MPISSDEERDRLVTEMDRRMADAKARGTFWFPSPAEVQAVQRYDRQRQIIKGLGW